MSKEKKGRCWWRRFASCCYQSVLNVEILAAMKTLAMSSAKLRLLAWKMWASNWHIFSRENTIFVLLSSNKMCPNPMAQPGLAFANATFCSDSVLMCIVWIWEQTAIISLYSTNWLVFITETECVYCAVRTGSLYIILRSAHTVYLCVLCGSENKQHLFPYTALTDWFV